MKKARKVLSLILALVMVLALAVTASAADRTITIKPPKGTDAETTNTYKIYKVFDAVVGENGHISYQIMASKKDADGNPSPALPEGIFSVDTAGNVTYVGTGLAVDGQENDLTKLNATDIAGLAAYVANDQPVTTVTARGETPVTTTVTDGYYYITTSTGTAVTVDSTNPDATVEDKNTIPTIEKTVNDEKNVIVEAGQVIEFEVTITVGKGATNYKLIDTMSAGLEFVENSMEVNGTPVTPEVNGQTITYAIPDGNLPEAGQTITITYSAKVTSDALSVEYAENSAYVTYGGGNNPTTPSEVHVYNAKITVTKNDGEGNALAGAGFVLQNAAGKYYKTELVDGKPDVSWVDTVAEATELTSTDTNNVMVFQGLPAGTYTLIENTVPAGYNKAADETFTITADQPGTDDDETVFDADNLAQSTTVVNNAGIELPSTGGIGTTIFTVVGGVLMVGAAILFITKKRSEDING